MGHTANVLVSQGARGFESLPLRQREVGFQAGFFRWRMPSRFEGRKPDGAEARSEEISAEIY